MCTLFRKYFPLSYLMDFGPKTGNEYLKVMKRTETIKAYIHIPYSNKRIM